jgi:pyruvate dehydrogenase E1 component alpha subunit/2-oxoisovalerate dehydrogenase E1 component
VSGEDLERIEVAVAEEIEEAVVFAEASPWEPVEHLLRDVCADTGAEGVRP